MNWLDLHLGSFGFAADVYMPMGNSVCPDNQQDNLQNDIQDTPQKKEQPKPVRPQQPKKDHKETKKLGSISYDALGNIERYFTYSEFLDYVDVPPVKDAPSHKLADSRYEDVLDFFLKETQDIAPFDNIDMDDDEYIANELADHIKRRHLFNSKDAEYITDKWTWNNKDEETKDWLNILCSSLGYVMFSFQLIDWAYWRSDAGLFGPKFNEKDKQAMNSLKNLRKEWRGYRNSGTSFRFYGTENFDQAMNMARYGWTEKMDKIRKLETEIPQIYKTVPIPETKFSVAGNSVDVGRYLMGVPDCMRQTRRRISEYADITHKYVQIVVNVTVSWTLGEDDIFNRGKNIATVINALESNNIHTKLILMNQVYKNETEEQKKSKVQSSDAPRYTTFIILKDYKDNFYLEKLMFPLAHRSFLRRLVFASKERESEDIRQKFGFHEGGGYGIPGDIFDDSDENTLYFNAGQYEQDKINEKLVKILKSHDAQFMQRLNTNKLER
ncbi:MAG: hypothetical protein II179_00030 [Alphaproteobacteria bacterium]|nr:hypothetical protein [Alphaproteobacteria bacterium]